MEYNYRSGIGWLRLEAKAGVLVSCQWADDEKCSPDALPSPQMAAIISWLDDYFAGKEAPLPPMCTDGTPFQQKIWREVMSVRKGECITYAELARRAACPKAVRAVANALGRNPLMLFVPCHRVIGSDGRLHGYAGGSERKRLLLEHEKTAADPCGSDICS